MSWSAPPGSSAGWRDLLGNRRAVFDSAAPLVVFAGVNAVAGLVPAAVGALGVAALTIVARRRAGQRSGLALGGAAGALVAVGAAVWTREATGYLAPGMVVNVVYSVGAAVSIVVGRPFVAVSSWALYRWPWSWYRHPRVRPAYAEATLPWVGLFALRAVVRWRIIAGGELGLSDTALLLATGWPAFAVLLVATYAYVPWRLGRLRAPPVGAPEGPGTPSGA